MTYVGEFRLPRHLKIIYIPKGIFQGQKIHAHYRIIENHSFNTTMRTPKGDAGFREDSGEGESRDVGSPGKASRGLSTSVRNEK